jgi:transcriptional antiterminator RfaH
VIFWGVAQTEPKREHIARTFLMRQEYETYAPRLRVKTGKISRITLLFPSYIFVQITERWYPMLRTPGVLRVLMSGETPAAVPDDLVLRIRMREGKDGLVRLPPPPSSGLEPGQLMTVMRGSFVGRLAIYQGMSGAERAKVLLNLLGRLVEAEVPIADLQAKDSDKATTTA